MHARTKYDNPGTRAELSVQSHYRLSTLILRHCPTDTGFTDDATAEGRRALEVESWKALVLCFARSETEKQERHGKPENGNWHNVYFFLHNIPVFNFDANASDFSADTRMALRSPCQTQSASLLRITLRIETKPL